MTDLDTSARAAQTAAERRRAATLPCIRSSAYPVVLTYAPAGGGMTQLDPHAG
jgi:hypothetical protein